jgi:hypothetical protein
METYEQQIFPNFEEESLSYRLAFPANPLPLPGSEEARAMAAGSGRQCSMLLDRSSPLGAFSKILLASSHWTNSEEYCYVWQRLDTKFGCSAFQLTPLGQNIEDGGCLLWRTPNAAIVTGGGQDGQKRLETGHAMQLSDQILNPKLWPTPTVPNGGRRNPEGTSITGKKPDGTKAQMDLREFALRMWPMPTERDWKSTSRAKQDNARPLSEVAGQTGRGSLNPDFVEWLMGFQIGHTRLKKPLMKQKKKSRAL